MTSRNMKANERRPIFRSVVLGRSNPPALLQQTSTTTSRAVPRPPSIAGRRIIRGSKVIQSNKSTSCCNINKNKTGNCSTFKPTALRRVPLFYPIEKTHRVVEEDNTTTADLLLPAIASRITNCLRNFSIQAVYDNQNASASLTTIEGVQMQLSLWDVSSIGEKSGKKKILVELQRRRGDCMTFHQYCRNILKVATTAARIDDIEKPDYVKNSNGKRKICTDAEQPKAKQQAKSRKAAAAAATKEDEEYESTVVALEIAHTLLTKDRMDAKQLGLESLCFLTDPNKSSVSTSARVIASQAVLFGVTEAPENTKMTSGTQIFQDMKVIISSLISSGAEQEAGEFANEAQFRNLALTIFANALHAIMIGKNSGTELHVFNKNDDVCDTVISKLVKELSHTEKLSPHTAYLSAKCLRLLCASYNIKQKVLMELEGANKKEDIIRSALDAGIRTHLKLELECRKFLEDILHPSN